MINLSKRLAMVASFVRSDAKIVDVGCDHALLDIYLAERYPHLKAIAIDLREGALAQARSNVIKYQMGEVITLRLGDGLDVVDKNEIDTIAISGLGCPKIIDILTKDKHKLDNVDDIIIQSNTDYYDVRKNICLMGYYIDDEVLVKESDIIYLIIHFKRGSKEYSEDDYLFGPFLRLNKNDLYKELIQIDINKKEILLKLIPQKYTLKKEQIKADILKLQNGLR